MKKPTDFIKLMTSYLGSYIPLQRNVSQNTISSYCDAFRLLLTFLRDEKAISIERVRIQDFSPGLIQEYLSWLSRDRRCGISTRNHRLAALRAFSSMWKLKVRSICSFARKLQIFHIQRKSKHLYAT